jgi:hypothetical protein
MNLASAPSLGSFSPERDGGDNQAVLCKPEIFIILCPEKKFLFNLTLHHEQIEITKGSLGLSAWEHGFVILFPGHCPA